MQRSLETTLPIGGHWYPSGFHGHQRAIVLAAYGHFGMAIDSADRGFV